MIDNDKISNTQLWMFLVLTMIGIGIFSLPRLAVEATGSDAWITTILGGLLGLLDFYIISRLAKRFPGDTLVEMSQKILGKILSIPLLLIFGLYLISSIAGMLRIFGEVIKMTLLTMTPIEVVLICILLVALLLARCGIEGIVRFDEAIFIVLFSLSVIGTLFALPQADFSNILPIMRTDAVSFIKGTYETVYSFSGFEIVFLIVPFIKKPEKIFRPGVIAFSIVTVTYVAAVILSLGYFGITETKHLIWPTLSMIRSIEVYGSFIERLEGVVMTQWVLFAFTSLVVFIYAISVLTSRVLKNKEFKHFCPFYIPIVYVIALLPENVPAVYDVLDKTVTYLGAPSLFIVPLLLLIVSSVRKMGVRENG